MVLLPHKYLQSKIPNHAKFSGEAAVKGGPVAQHEVTLEEQAIIDNWEHERMLCSSPQVIDGSPCLETGRDNTILSVDHPSGMFTLLLHIYFAPPNKR